MKGKKYYNENLQVGEKQKRRLPVKQVLFELSRVYSTS